MSSKFPTVKILERLWELGDSCLNNARFLHTHGRPRELGRAAAFHVATVAVNEEIEKLVKTRTN